MPARDADKDELDPFAPAIHVAPERKLWLAVLIQAITDAEGPAPLEPGVVRRRRKGGGHATGNHGDIEPARSFLRGSSPGLALSLMACNAAHDWWRSRALPVLEAQWRAADAERALHEAMALEAAGHQAEAAALLARAAELEAA
jgi:hypothetical protein